MANTETVKRMLRTRGALVAAVTAGGVGVWIVVTAIVQQFIQLIGLASAGYDLTQSTQYFWTGMAQQIFLFALPFAIGFFLSLWLVAPISEALGIGHVITRSVLATGIASTIYFIVRVIADLIAQLAFDRPIFANSFPQVSLDGPGMLVILGSDLQGALSALVTLLPLGVLAGILLWHWRKANPPQFHVSGLIDV